MARCSIQGRCYMLTRLLRRFLQPYQGSIVIVVLLQLVGTIASLFLPNLNGDIIDQGVAKGDTSHILSVGAIMLGVAALQIGCSIVAVYFGAGMAMRFGRD